MDYAYGRFGEGGLQPYAGVDHKFAKSTELNQLAYHNTSPTHHWMVALRDP